MAVTGLAETPAVRPLLPQAVKASPAHAIPAVARRTYERAVALRANMCVLSSGSTDTERGVCAG
jgi:hypothetical protein